MLSALFHWGKRADLLVTFSVTEKQCLLCAIRTRNSSISTAVENLPSALPDSTAPSGEAPVRCQLERIMKSTCRFCPVMVIAEPYVNRSRRDFRELGNAAANRCLHVLLSITSFLDHP
jgi:hypothetical protein